MSAILNVTFPTGHAVTAVCTGPATFTLTAGAESPSGTYPMDFTGKTAGTYKVDVYYAGLYLIATTYVAWDGTDVTLTLASSGGGGAATSWPITWNIHD